MTLLDDAKFFFDPAATLTVSGGGAIDLGNLSLAKLAGLTSAVALGTYDLIDGTGILDTQNVQNFGQAGQASIGDDKFAYFDAQGSTFQVVVVPEPGMLGLLAVLAGTALVWRRIGR